MYLLCFTLLNHITIFHQSHTSLKLLVSTWGNNKQIHIYLYHTPIIHIFQTLIQRLKTKQSCKKETDSCAVHFVPMQRVLWRSYSKHTSVSFYHTKKHQWSVNPLSNSFLSQFHIGDITGYRIQVNIWIWSLTAP